MKAASLLCVFLLAKALVLAGRELVWSPWTPIAYLWQDLIVVLLFGLFEFLVRRPRIVWTAYLSIVLYSAINVPVARVLSTPLTWPLLRGARGALADSILLYATWGNVLCLLLVLAVGVGLPFALRRVRARRLALAGAIVLPPIIMLGPLASTKVETLGLHRNVLAALVTTALPRVPAGGGDKDWRTSPLPMEDVGDDLGDDLTHLRGIAAGRNVVLIHLESTAAQYLGLCGARPDPMPNLTRLAQQGVFFPNAYAVYPESIKGLFSVLCSTYPAIDTAVEAHARVATPSLASVLTAGGYRTGLFHSGRFAYLGMEAIVGNRGYQTLEDAGHIGGNFESSFGVDEEATVERMLAWLDERPAGQRFFLTYLPIAGHHPYQTPRDGPFPEKELFDRYRNALHYADEAVGLLLQGLRQRGLERNTLFILLGDHGEAFGRHPGNFGHVLFLYEENVRVPLLFAAPGAIATPVRVERPASLIDAAPTALDLLGLPAPRAYQGESLLDARPRLGLFYTDYSLALLGLRDGPWKLIHEIESGRSKLFDLRRDPDETADLAGQFPDRVGAYRDHLLQWAAAGRQRILTR